MIKICDRGKAFGIRTAHINGNDPVESYIRLQEEMEYIRKNAKPVLLEAEVSRLYGHSSASGANFVTNEEDCLRSYEERLFKAGFLKEQDAKDLYKRYDKESLEIQERVRLEENPKADSIWDHTYVNSENADWRAF